MDVENLDPLAKAYFEKFLVRTKVLEEYFKLKDYSDVIREGQEALELFLKGLLRSVGVEPSYTHDPGKELLPIKNRLPQVFSKEADDLITWSKKLRRDRELSFYGATDFIPTQEYSEEEAKEVLSFLKKIASLLRQWLKK